MKKYNAALDYTAMALAATVDGQFEVAAKLLVQASKQKDAVMAVRILEVNNDQAYTKATAAQSTAAKAGSKAAARIKASQQAKTQVRAFDIGDEEDISDLTEDEPVEAGEEDMDEVENEFASMLKAMVQKPAPKRK